MTRTAFRLGYRLARQIARGDPGAARARALCRANGLDLFWAWMAFGNRHALDPLGRPLWMRRAAQERAAGPG